MFFFDTVFNQWGVFLLVLFRTGALLMTLPLFGSNNVPAMAKAGIVLAVTVWLTPVVRIDPALYPKTLAQLFLLGAGEIMIGALLGLVVRLLLGAVQVMGQLAGFQMGFAVANVLDPVTGGQVSVLAQFAYLMTLLVFLAVDAHHWFFMALADSFKLLPPGGFGLSQSLFDQMMHYSEMMFSLAVRIGAPVIGALLFTQVALGILAKTVPQMNILIVGFPITITVGLIFMGLTMTVLVPMMAKTFGELGPQLIGLIKAMR